jgi:hypothetical protein
VRLRLGQPVEVLVGGVDGSVQRIVRVQQLRERRLIFRVQTNKPAGDVDELLPRSEARSLAVNVRHLNVAQHALELFVGQRIGQELIDVLTGDLRRLHRLVGIVLLAELAGAVEHLDMVGHEALQAR